MVRAGIFLLAPALLSLSGSPQEEPRPRPPAAPETARSRVLPREFYEAPRQPVGEKPGSPPPLTLWLRRGSASACFQTRFSGDRPEAVWLPLPGERAPARKLGVVQLAWDALRQTRFFAYDGGETLRGTFEAGPSAGERFALADGWELRAQPAEESGCGAVLHAAPPIGRMEAGEKTGPNAGAVLVRVELTGEQDGAPAEPFWGWCIAEGRGGASVASAIHSPGRGATREWTLFSYVPEDGGSAAIVLEMSAVWKDPRDGRDYRYAQFGGTGFVTLEKSGSARRVLSPGPSVPGSVDLTAVLEADWADCQSRAGASGRRRSR